MQFRSRKTWQITIADYLRDRALTKKDATAYIFLEDGERELVLTYQQLDRQAKAIAAYLQSIGAKNRRALLLYPPGLDFIAAFFGCFYAGVIAVPVYPPRGNKNRSRLLKIANDAKAKIALTTETVLNYRVKWQNNQTLNQIEWLATDKIAPSWGVNWQYREINPDRLAFLQYTSGSTGTPKGVMVTHANLMHNEEAICNAFGHDETTTVVGWLPINPIS